MEITSPGRDTVNQNAGNTWHVGRNLLLCRLLVLTVPACRCTTDRRTADAFRPGGSIMNILGNVRNLRAVRGPEIITLEKCSVRRNAAIREYSSGCQEDKVSIVKIS